MATTKYQAMLDVLNGKPIEQTRKPGKITKAKPLPLVKET